MKRISHLRSISFCLWMAICLSGVLPVCGQALPPVATVDGASPLSPQRIAALDAAIEQQYVEKQLPALVVLYAEEGRLCYKRLLGYADLEAKTPITESHIFRLASVSKLVAAVVGLRLAERQILDLEAPLAQYLPEIPSHHTARVIDLLACRGGVRHYRDPSAPQSPRFWEARTYPTALAAAQQFWHDPLAKPVGAYHYSTHGYTLFAACVEQATGLPIAEVIRQEIAEPADLQTLAAEDRTQLQPLRVTLYRRNTAAANGPANRPVRPDNLSWKVCGGGLECSAWELLRFGVLLCRGHYLSPESLQRLHTRWEPAESYALGCSHLAVHGHAVFDKSGGQTGVNSYIWCAPQRQAVMVVLTNRQEDAGAPQLGKALMHIVLAPTDE